MATPITRFDQLGLKEPVLDAVRELGYETVYPIQAEGIPPLLEGRDLLGQAQTGTGKTAAFALPILSRLDLSLKKPQALVMTPTRELALQVAEAMQSYARHLAGFHVLPVYGGQSIDAQFRHLRRGVHAVVGTPGRILDHLRRGTLKLSSLTTVVLDEADEMLNMGFLQDVKEILDHTPEKKQVALFSATMPAAIRRVTERYLKDPVVIRIRAKTATVEATSQRYWLVSGTHKLDALTRILEVEEFEAMLIFVRTRIATTSLAEKLEARGFPSAALSGEMSQTNREQTIDRLKRGKLDILVATDVAARGLDVDRITHVINYDVPFDTESYVHRIGRTGRAGRSGQAIIFVSPREKRMLRAIESATRQRITPMQLPTRGAVAGRRVELFKKKIADALSSEDLSFFEELVASYQEENDTGLSELAAALAFLAQGERLLAPAEPDPPPARRPKPAPRATRPAAAPMTRDTTRAKPHAGAQATARSTVSPRPDRSVAEGMERYRLEIGRDHGVHPKHIVGAIANEVGLDSEFIGPIKINADYATVDLPEGMPKPVFKLLRKVWVCGRKLQLSLLEDASRANGTARPARSKPARRPTRSDKPNRPKTGAKAARPKMRVKRPKKPNR